MNTTKKTNLQLIVLIAVFIGKEPNIDCRYMYRHLTLSAKETGKIVLGVPRQEVIKRIKNLYLPLKEKSDTLVFFLNY